MYALKLLVGTSCLKVHVHMLKPVIDKDSANLRLLADLRFARTMSLPPLKTVIIIGKPFG